MRRRTRVAARRSGVSMVEMMVAIVILAIGVLGMASTSGYVAGQMGGGKHQTVAATVSQQVYDSLTASPCASLASGTDTKRNVTVAWTVADSGRYKYVQQTLTYKTRRGTRTLVYANLLPCS